MWLAVIQGHIAAPVQLGSVEQMLTQQQVSEFEEQGLIRLPLRVPAAVALAMRDRVWAFLSVMHGRRQDDPTTWTALDGRTGFKMLLRTGAFDELSEHLAEPVTDLLGPGGWNPPAHWGHPLVTFPDPDRVWAIPATGWHVDSHQFSVGELPGVVAFTFLDDVRPRGGGTLVMPGSHRVTWRLCQRAGGFMRTGEMKAILASEAAWFAELWREAVTDSDRLRRYLDDGAVVDGTHVRVTELCGQPGDVVLMNQRVLHVAAPNVRSTPRVMLADFIS
jgi:ectoine hydroxylase-related dioxygenase (phytanoyl-CoA dioxygenase family)